MDVVECQKCKQQIDSDKTYKLMGFEYCERCYEEECKRLRDETNPPPTPPGEGDKPEFLI